MLNFRGIFTVFASSEHILGSRKKYIAQSVNDLSNNPSF